MFIWIWQLQSQVQKYGSIGNLINKLKNLNINNVCIKYHEGSSATGGGINFRSDFLKYKDNFKNAGFKVGTWGYNYFNYVTDETGLILSAIKDSDYYIFDPEDEVRNKFEQAEKVCSVVRSAFANAQIGYSTFPIVSYHKDIPYSIFNKYCDFASPQAYWGEMKWNVQECVGKMIEDYKNFGLTKPIYPSIQTYGCDVASYNIFKNYGFENYGAYSLDDIDSTAEKFIVNTSTDAKENNTNINTIDISSVKYLQHEINVQFNLNIAEDNIAGNETLKNCPIVKKGASGNITKWIQNKLKVYIDGIFGEKTKQAVIAFQRDSGISQDGIVGKDTWSFLLNISKPEKYDVKYLQHQIGAVEDNIAGSETLDKCPIIKKGISSNVVRWIQKKLGITVDGIFGDETFKAVCNFQLKYGLTVDGVVGKNTWSKLLNL